MINVKHDNSDDRDDNDSDNDDGKDGGGDIDDYTDDNNGGFWWWRWLLMMLRMMIFRTRGIAITRSIMAILCTVNGLIRAKGKFGQVVGIDWFITRDVHGTVWPMYIWVCLKIVYP